MDTIALVIQAFVVSRAMKYLGFGFAFLVLPLMALTDGVVMAVWPVLAAVAAGKVAESGVDYSFNNTVRNVLWLPTSRRAKYVAKQATDTFFVRAGDLSSAAVVFVGVRLFGMPVRAIAVVNVLLVLAWLLLARAILKERARLVGEERNSVEGVGAVRTTTPVADTA